MDCGMVAAAVVVQVANATMGKSQTGGRVSTSSQQSSRALQTRMQDERSASGPAETRLCVSFGEQSRKRRRALVG